MAGQRAISTVHVLAVVLVLVLLICGAVGMQIQCHKPPVQPVTGCGEVIITCAKCLTDCGQGVVTCIGACTVTAGPLALLCIATCGATNILCMANCPPAPAPAPPPALLGSHHPLSPAPQAQSHVPHLGVGGVY